MAKENVNDTIEYAILAIASSYPDMEHQNYWTSWEQLIRRLLPADFICTNDDIRWAFENLAQERYVRITKPDAMQKYAVEYSSDIRQGLADIDSRTFFHTRPFTVSITPEGAKYWRTRQTESDLAKQIASRQPNMR